MSFRSNIFGQKYISSLFGEITDLSAGEIYGKGAELSFTPPWSTYPISSYKVYMNGIEHETITAIDCLINLTPSSSHQVSIRPVDVNGNIGQESNIIIINTPVWQTFLFDNFPQMNAVYGLKRLTSTAVSAVRLQRNTDLAEVDLLLPATGFISMLSEVTGGQTLSDWIGVNSAKILKWYDQKASNHLLAQASSKGESFLVENGVLVTDNGMPCVKMYKSSLTDPATLGWSMACVGFAGALNSTYEIVSASIFQLYNHVPGADPTKSSGICGFTESLSDLTPTQKKLILDSKGGISYYGAREDGPEYSIDETIRSTFRNHLLQTNDWNDGKLNISDSGGLQTHRYCFGLYWNNNENAPYLLQHCYAVSILKEYKKIRRLIEHQLNLEYNNYTVL